MRGVSNISGLRDIRSHNSTSKRSIPRIQSSAHLELYVLGKEKERLEKEAALLEKRNQAIGRRVGDIRQQAEALEGSASRAEGRTGDDEGRREGGKPAKKKWKTFSMNY